MRLAMGRSMAPGRGRFGRARWRLSVAAAMACGTLVAGCHVPFTGASGAPTVRASLTVVASPGVADAPLYIAMHAGMFRDAGLKVNVINAPSFRAEVKALQDHTAQVAFGDYADIFYTQQQLLGQAHGHKPQGLTIVADGYDASTSVMEVLTLPNSGITTPASLTNKTIGTPVPQVMPSTSGGGQPVPYSLETVAADSVLYTDQVDLSKITWKPMPTPNLIPALKTGQVSAILATEPTIFQAETQLGAVPVVDAATGQTANLPLDGYFSASSYSSAHAAVLREFASAIYRAQASAGQAQPVQVALEKFAKLPPATASLINVGVYPTSLKAVSLQRIVSLMLFFGALQTPVNPANMVLH